MATTADSAAAAAFAGVSLLTNAWWSRGARARLLWPVAALFGSLVALRHALYRRGLLRTETLPVPVAVVGNVIVGGAGKTPTVMAVVEALRSRGWHPGIISRGHGRHDNAVLEVRPGAEVARCGDEPLLLRIRLGVPVFVGRDRVAAARALLHAHPTVDIIVSDDGLQHLRLPRAAQVLVFDDRGVGNGWLLPAGPLREPLPSRVPPRTLVLYNATRASTALPGHMAQRGLAGAVSLRDWWAGSAASPSALQALNARPVVAAAGLAHPQRFFEMLRAVGLDISPLPLPDHHDFATLPWPAGTHDVVVTEKDAVKLSPDRVSPTRVWVAPLDFRLDAGFERELLALLPPSTPRNADGYPTA